MNASSLILNPDGETASATYLYLDAGGKKLTNINASAFDSHLLPVMEAGSYFQPTVNSTSVSMKIVSLTADGEVLGLGKEYVGVLRAADCPAVASETMILKVKDPFDGMAVRDYGTVNDYTLFALNGVEDDLRSAFSDEIDANKSFEGVVTTAYTAVEVGNGVLTASEVFGEGYNYLIAYTINGVPS